MAIVIFFKNKKRCLIKIRIPLSKMIIMVLRNNKLTFKTNNDDLSLFSLSFKWFV